MKIGAHVSAAGGIFNAPLNAAKIGCEVFQVFTRSPQGGPAPKLTDEVVAKFKAEVKKYKLGEFVIHTPYYINFASTTPRIRYGSISVVREELERGTLLGASFVVTHLGSTKDAGPKVGFHKTWRSIQLILDGYKGTTRLLLELSAGAGDLVGGSFEQIRDLIKNAESNVKFRNMVNVCVDTCHAFAAGYDLRAKADVEAMVKRFDAIVGLKRLKLLHGNDSKFGLGDHRDRHEHIGKGTIGKEAFRALLHMSKLKNVDMIVETPDDGNQDDIRVLKQLRSS
ncbi:MAG: deoxyribonuclease IV [Candidatus Kerfeldbacteria bacterium]|nr:deoxyribonuclease IV [Candidatus Kerfeldbacteria bacterium]